MGGKRKEYKTTTNLGGEKKRRRGKGEKKGLFY